MQVVAVFRDDRRAKDYARAENSICAEHKDLVHGRFDVLDAHEGRETKLPLNKKTIFGHAAVIARRAYLTLLHERGNTMREISKAVSLKTNGASRVALRYIGITSTKDAHTERQKARREQFTALWESNTPAAEIARIMRMSGQQSVYNRVRDLGLRTRDPISRTGAVVGERPMTRPCTTPLRPPPPFDAFAIPAKPLERPIQRRCPCNTVFEARTLDEVLCQPCVRAGRRERVAS